MDWEQAKIDYITNTQESYRSIAEKYGVSATQVANHSKDENWRQLRDEYLKNVCTQTLDAMAKQTAAREVKIVGVADKLLAKLDLAVDKCEPEVLVKNTKLVRALTGAVMDLKSIFDIRSQADKDEQKARIDNLRKRAEKENDTIDGIEVVFLAGEEAWNE